jgi:hypothetical protein
MMAAACVTVMVTMDASCSRSRTVLVGRAIVFAMGDLDMPYIVADAASGRNVCGTYVHRSYLDGMARHETYTVKHRKTTYVVTRVSPVGLADARQVVYTVPRSTDERVTVYGHLLPATFIVEGWRHEVVMTLDADMRSSPDHGVYVSQLTINVGDGMPGTPSQHEPRLVSTADVRGMPLGVWLDAAVRLCAFRGTARPYRLDVKAGNTTAALRGRMVSYSSPRIATNGRDALEIDAVGLAARTPARHVKTRTGRNTKREELPPWNGDEALRNIARLWREQRARPSVRGGMPLIEWLASQTGRPANTCSQQLSEARKRGLLPRGTSRHMAAPSTTNKTKRGKR